MADTTPLFNFPYLELGDPPDIATGLEDLAQAVETKIAAVDSAITTIQGVNTSQNADITALENANTAQGFQFIRKTADETVTSNDTPQLDNHLDFTALGGQRYLVKVVCFVEVAGGNSTTDFRAGFLLPAGAAAAFGGTGPDPAMAASSSVGGGQWQALYGTVNGYLRFGLYNAGTTKVEIEGIITMGVSTGTVTFAWSQDNPSANGVTVKANSFMKVNKIS
ncbi:hypothetical protein [Kribbella italica]|uniref:Uncharacterized protein n=1 Tax=Kribbella italica TaxID=1540520 RepID=A0A7W9JAR5_9ACTN|nr:hypothetical protein [Kribbella italica]MBB5838717.1 hypothetical protein [Kribbella italica]